MINIEIKNLEKEIKKVKVLDDINMSMQSGKIYGFQGINGSGKTMLMRVISGLIYATKGSIKVNDKELGKDIAFPNSIGIFLENPSFIESYSGFYNLKMLASIQDKTSDEEIENVLTKVGLNCKDKKKYKKYSLGMKQRLGIAAAVMEKPEIVILDEPTNSLDSSGVELVKNILMEEKKRNALVIISCHDLSILESMSDEIFVLTEGKVSDHIIR